MNVPPDCKSDVARLREQIELEYQGARNGLHDLSQGSASHEAITAKTARMAERVEELTELVGPEEAMVIFDKVTNKVQATTPNQLEVEREKESMSKPPHRQRGNNHKKLARKTPFRKTYHYP